MDTIEPEAQIWNWEGWLPTGNLTLLVGEGGTGKSTLMAKLAAITTTDGLMPDGSDCVKGGVVWVSLEEQVASQVVPRLVANGADLSKLVDLHEVTNEVKRLGDPIKRKFMLPDDLEALEKQVIRKGASLVIIDPLLGAINPARSTAIGRSAIDLLSQIQAMAERLEIAIVGIMHFTKGVNKNIINRVGGSKEWTNGARSIWVVTVDPQNPELSVLSLQKHSCGPNRPDIAYKRAPNGAIEFLSGMNATQQQAQAVKQILTTREAVLGLLNSRPDYDFTGAEIAQTVRMDGANCRNLLRRMVHDGSIAQTARKYYHAYPVTV